MSNNLLRVDGYVINLDDVQAMQFVRGNTLNNDVIWVTFRKESVWKFAPEEGKVFCQLKEFIENGTRPEQEPT